MADDAARFESAQQLREKGIELRYAQFEGRDINMDFVRLYEAKMLHLFDHRWASVSEMDDEVSINRLDPCAYAMPRYFIAARSVNEYLAGLWDYDWLLGWREITNTTNERTTIASILPKVGVGHTCHMIYPVSATPVETACLSANLSSFALDYLSRLKIGGTHLTHSHLRQLPVLSPGQLVAECQWTSPKSPVDFMRPRTLELTYTAWDLEPFARDCGYEGPPFRWDEERRFWLRCELDAAFFHLYGIERDDVDYILETFPIVKRKDVARTEVKEATGKVIRPGTFITKDTILAIYDQLAAAIASGQPYQTHLDPPPGPPADAAGNFLPLSAWDQAHWPRHIHPPRAERAAP